MQPQVAVKVRLVEAVFPCLFVSVSLVTWKLSFQCLEALILVPCFEWVKMNQDTGAAVNTFPLNFRPDGAGYGRFCRTAGGEYS